MPPHRSRVGRYFWPGAVIAALILLADQFTKWLVIEGLLRTEGPLPGGFLTWLSHMRPIEFFVDERESFNTLVLAPCLNFVMVWNQGVSFGLFSGSALSAAALVFIGISLAASLGMLIWLALTTRKLTAMSLSLVIGGALGNAWDRIRFGAVADFIDFHIGGWHWPAFNLADSAIAIGAALMILDTLRDNGDRHEKNA